MSVMMTYHYLNSGNSPHFCRRLWFKAFLHEFGIIGIMSSKPEPEQKLKSIMKELNEIWTIGTGTIHMKFRSKFPEISSIDKEL